MEPPRVVVQHAATEFVTRAVERVLLFHSVGPIDFTGTEPCDIFWCRGFDVGLNLIFCGFAVHTIVIECATGRTTPPTAAAKAALKSDFRRQGALAHREGSEPPAPGLGLGLGLELGELLSSLRSRPNKPWSQRFWRTGADPARSYQRLVAQLQVDGIWRSSPSPRWRPRQPGRYLDSAAEAVEEDIDTLQNAEAADAIEARDAVTLELLVVSRARTWIPLEPAPAADFLATADDLGAPCRDACREIIDSLIEVRHLAGETGMTTDPGGSES